MSGSWRCVCQHMRPKHRYGRACTACVRCGMAADEHKFLGCNRFKACDCREFRETAA